MSETGENGAAARGGRGRRVWPADLKRRIIAESFEAGASAAEVARRHGLNANLLFTWRRKLRANGSKIAQAPLRIVPVAVTREATASCATALPGPSGRMEIVLAEG
ncbi:MAG: IS66-like element accessory protein TnpA, partial [Acetobacteraceae bacterium]